MTIVPVLHLRRCYYSSKFLNFLIFFLSVCLLRLLIGKHHFLYAQNQPRPRKEFEKLQLCMSSGWNELPQKHPKSPVNYMPPADNLILPIVRNFSFCATPKDNLRVVFVLNRQESKGMRSVIRKTYGDFNQYNQASFVGNWTLFFLVGKPFSRKMEEDLSVEGSIEGDLIVSNIPDSYYQTTYKLLVGIKAATCLCPHAKFLIKSDDDTYLRIRKLDQVIYRQQREANADRIIKANYIGALKLSSNEDVPIFSGSNCAGYFPANREGPQAVTKKKFVKNILPYFCYGHFNIFSMETAKGIAANCQYHCVGQTLLQSLNHPGAYCYHVIEDEFIGSCVHYTQGDKTVQMFIPRSLAIHVEFAKEIAVSGDLEKHIAIHGNKNPEEMMATHQFYYRKTKQF